MEHSLRLPELWRRGRVAARRVMRDALIHGGLIRPHGEILDDTLQRRIDSVRSGIYQLSDIEYGILLGVVLARAPARVLVFGLGADSELWLWANRGGRTVFLEDRAEWVKAVAGAECYIVSYPGFELPQTLSGIAWDVIFVDGPMGWRPEHPGRRESIRAASKLAGAGSWIFIHDYDRANERACCDEYLGTPAYTVDRTAVFRPA